MGLWDEFLNLATFGAHEQRRASSVATPSRSSWEALEYKATPPSRDPLPLIGGRTNAFTWTDDQVKGFVRESFRIAGIVYRGGTLIADAAAEAPLRVYREVDAQPVEQPKHPIRQLLVEPNPEQGEAEFMTTLVLIAFMNGYAYVEKVRNALRDVVQLYPRTPDTIKKVKQSDGTYIYHQRIGNDTRLIPLTDLFIVPYQFDPELRRSGISPVSVLGREIGIEVTLTTYLKSFIDESGIPPFALVSKDAIVDPETVTEIQETWNAKYAHGRSWATPPVLANYDIKKIGLDFNEMAYPDLRGITELRIAQGLGIPPHLLAAREAIQNGGLSTTEMQQAMSFFQMFTVTQLRNRIDAAFTRNLLREVEPDRNFTLEFDTTGIKSLQEDEDKRATRIRADFTASLISREEARKERGYSDEPANGETLVLPFSMTEIIVGETPEPPLPPVVNPPALPAVVPPKAGANQTAQKRDLTKMSAEQLERRSALSDQNRKSQKKLTELGNRALKKFWKDQGERFAKLAVQKSDGEPWVRRNLITLLQLSGDPVLSAKAEHDCKRSVGDRFYSAAFDHTWLLGFKELAELNAINWDAEATALKAVMDKFYATAGTQAASDASAALGVDLSWDVVNPNISLVMDDLGKRIVGLNDTTRLDVAKVVSDSLTAGDGVDQIAARITGLFEQTYKSRALTVARTESMYSYSMSSIETYKQSNVVKDVEMLDNPLHATDPMQPTNTTCADRDGLTAPLSKASDYVDSAHPNCILCVTPVID